MELATLIENHREAFEAKYADRLLPAHLHALDAISRCRTPAAGEVLARSPSADKLSGIPTRADTAAAPSARTLR